MELVVQVGFFILFYFPFFPLVFTPECFELWPCVGVCHWTTGLFKVSMHCRSVGHIYI